MARIYSNLIHSEIELTDQLQEELTTLAERISINREKSFRPEEVLDVALRGVTMDEDMLDNIEIDSLGNFVSEWLMFYKEAA